MEQKEEKEGRDVNQNNGEFGEENEVINVEEKVEENFEEPENIKEVIIVN